MQVRSEAGIHFRRQAKLHTGLMEPRQPHQLQISIRNWPCAGQQTHAVRGADQQAKGQARIHPAAKGATSARIGYTVDEQWQALGLPYG